MSDLFESCIGKLAISPELKKSIIGIHKACLEAESIAPESEKIPGPGENTADAGKPIRDLAAQIVNDVNKDPSNAEDANKYKKAIIDTVISYKPKIDECVKLNKNALTAIAATIDRQTKNMAGNARISLDELAVALGYKQPNQ